MFVCGTKEEKLVCWLNKRRKQVEFSLEPYTRENRYRLEFLKGDIYRLLFSSFIKEDVVVGFVCEGRKKLIDYLRKFKVNNINTYKKKKLDYVKCVFSKDIAVMFFYFMFFDYAMPTFLSFTVRKNKGADDIIYISRNGRLYCDSFVLNNKNLERRFVDILRKFAKTRVLGFEVKKLK